MTNAIEKFIQRPVLAWVLSIVIIMLGLVSWRQLSLRQYPQIEHPVITILTPFDGAGPDIVESQITRPLEEAMAGLEGLDFMVSSSISEQSKIRLFFKNSRPVDAASSDVRDRLARIRNLPENAGDSTIRKADADAEPIVYMALYGDSAFAAELSDYATRYLESEFEAIQGVAAIDVNGGGGYEMHIVLDPVRMASYKITAVDIRTALRSQNLKKPAGRLTGNDREFLVTTTANMTKPEHFNNLVLLERDGYVVRLSDVGKAQLSTGDNRFIVRYNGRSAVMLGIVAQSKANPIAISAAVRKKLEVVRESLPPGMACDIANDRSIFIERSISQVYQAIFEATILVILVVFLFLRSFQASLVPLITIPISLIGVFFVIYILGFTLNTLTLLAIVLAIGLVVDDAIVVLENIYRYIEDGFTPIEAAVQGTKEIQFSVIAMTLTLAAVYTPIALSSGVTGKLFTEFALTLVGAVLISGFVALTLSPMMCARLLKAHGTAGTTAKKSGSFAHFAAQADRFLDRVVLRGMETVYVRVLERALESRRIVIGLGVCVGTAGYLLVQQQAIKSELAPREDQGVLKTVAVSTVGATVSYVDRYLWQMEEALGSVPEIDRRLTVIQAGDDSYSVNLLRPWERRTRKCLDMLPDLQTLLEDIPGLYVRAMCPSRSLMGGATDRPLEIVVQTNKSFKELVEVAVAVRRVVGRHPGVLAEGLDWDLAGVSKDWVVKVDRDLAADLGVDPESIAQTLDILISGRRSTSFEMTGKQYPVRVWMGEMYRKGPQDISSLYVRGSKNKKEVMIPLVDLVNVKERFSNPEINRFSGMRAVTLKSPLRTGFGLGNVYQELKQEIRKILPQGYRVTEAGELRRFLEESNTIFLIFGLALVFIFLVMAAQFESFIDPVIIMLSVPLALAGAVIVLWIIPGGTLNLYSQVGFVTLIGLITKHGILMVDFANALQDRGLTPIQAIAQACHLRLRPILMTTLAMVLGAVPLALATGAGSEGRRQIGWVIVGGMSIGTLFTLFIVPVVYTFLSRHKPVTNTVVS